jgi:hypothetical protein
MATAEYGFRGSMDRSRTAPKCIPDAYAAKVEKERLGA